MSEETKTVLSSETPEVVPSASAEAHQASSDSSPDVVTNDVRTLQDVERDIQEEKAQLDRARKEYREDQSDYEALLAASREDPNNKALSVQLDNARKFRDFSKKLIDISARCLAWLEGDLAEMQAALFEQKVRAGPIRLPQNHPMVKMWENVLKGEVKQDVASYEHIITSVFQHGALPFSDNSPPKDASGDFVLIERKSHTALYNEIANVAEKNTRDKSLDHAGHGYVVVGPPGIGNSCSLNLVFLRCAAIEEVSEGSGKRRRPVIVCDRAVDKEDGRYLIFTPGTDPKVEISYVKPDALRDRQNIYLFESPKDSASHDRYIHEYNSAFYVVASNPNRNIDEGIQNSARMSYAYCWEPEEAEEVQKALGLQADPAVVARCGFSLRLLTTGQAGAVTAMQRVESALDAVHSQYDLRRMAFKFRRHDGGLSTLSTALLTMKPCNGGWGCLYSICPVSDYVRQRLRSKLGTQQLPGMDYIVDLFD